MTDNVLAFLIAYVPLRELAQWTYTRYVNARWNNALNRLGVSVAAFEAELKKMDSEAKKK